MNIDFESISERLAWALVCVIIVTVIVLITLGGIYVVAGVAGHIPGFGEVTCKVPGEEGLDSEKKEMIMY